MSKKSKPVKQENFYLTIAERLKNVSKYDSNIEVNYDTYNACQDGSDCCSNDYCRCGIIENISIKRVFTIKKLLDSLKESDFLYRKKNISFQS